MVCDVLEPEGESLAADLRVTNVTGAFLGIRHMAPLMRDAAGGAIVNVSSTAGLIAHGARLKRRAKGLPAD